MNYLPIDQYGVIGDLHTVALVGMNGSIDFMCFPQFDSASIFGAMLDSKKGGHFQIAPVLENARQKQQYLPDTNILMTRFLSDDGVAEISDYMPVDEIGHAHQVVRRVKTVRGKIRFRMSCDPRFNYGQSESRLTKRGKNEVRWEPKGGDLKALCLYGGVPLKTVGETVKAEFTLSAGEHVYFVLGEPESESGPFPLNDKFLTETFKRTADFWRDWINRSNYRGRWREMVNRSALTLKLLISKREGSMVAAPTFGLPEQLGGARNWDYRYTWIRDASFSVYGLMRLGYTDEAGAFMRWIEKRCEELTAEGTLQIMYGLDGRKELSETILPDWEGYQGSKPVRVGNAAMDQVQLDIYGEMMDSVYLYDELGEPISRDFWANLSKLMDWVCAHWMEKGDGIWEVRGGKQEFLYSRVMCWVALDRAIRLARKHSYPAPLERWQEARDAIYKEVFTNFWDEERQAFVQHKGSKRVDAASLLMPLVKFISPKDPRWLSTLKAIEEDLVVDSLVYRYLTDGEALDGMTGSEGTFNMCSFWYVECLSRAGNLDQARFVFEKMLGYSSHLGLFSEELGPKGEHMGNFPQAFSHLALISAAFDLDRRLEKAGKA